MTYFIWHRADNFKQQWASAFLLLFILLWTLIRNLKLNNLRWKVKWNKYWMQCSNMNDPLTSSFVFSYPWFVLTILHKAIRHKSKSGRSMKISTRIDSRNALNFKRKLGQAYKSWQFRESPCNLLSRELIIHVIINQGDGKSSLNAIHRSFLSILIESQLWKYGLLWAFSSF